jgi:outer membrane lipoprotein-sorting protein
MEVIEMRREIGALVVMGMAVAAGPAAALTGREVIDNAQKKHGFSTWHDRVADMQMESYTTSLQRTREVTVTEQTDPRGEHRTFMEFTGPADVTGTLFLHLSPRGEKDQQWVWTPASRKARRLADASRDENFMGTDLSYRDLELIVRIQQWNDDEATATLEPDGEVDGKPCNVVTLVPKNTEEFPYARYRLWFGKDDLLLWQVEVDDLEKRLFKRVRLSRYERVQDFATAQESDIANVQYNTHTTYKLRNIRYNSGVSDDTFSVANVQKGR